MITIGEYRGFSIGLLNRAIPDKATVLSDTELRSERNGYLARCFSAPFSLSFTPLLTVEL